MLTRLSWLVLAIIHALPALAFFSPSLLTRLYNVAPGEPAFLLLQHRAALFLGVLIACIWAAAEPGVWRLAVIVTATSMVSFLLLYFQAGMPAPLRTIAIAIADVAGLIPLAYVAYNAFAVPPD